MVWQIVFEPPVRYPDVDFLDGNFREVVVAEPEPGAALALQTGTGAFDFGRPVSPNALPTKAVWRSREPAYDYATLYGATVVSDRLRQLIETLEPGVHQYFPLELVDADGRPVASHSIWIPCNRIDSVDRAHTTMVLPPGAFWRPADEIPEAERPPGADPSLPPKLVFSAAQSAGFEFWRDKHVRRLLFCSDRVAEAIETEGLVGVGLLKRETA